MSETVNARNIAALHEALKAERARVDRLVELVANLEIQSAMQNASVIEIQQKMAVMIASRGHGPTTR